jgi:hypothetical protein
MHKLTVVSTLVLSAFLASGCDDTKSSVAAPTTLNAGGVSASVTAGSAVADPNVSGTCPAFTIPLSIVVQAGVSGLTVTDVSARFIDSLGVAMPQVTLPAPVPMTQFGSELIDARSPRTIPFTLPIGCTLGRGGTVVVLLSTRDRHGRTTTTTVTTPVGPTGGAPGSAPGGTPGGAPGGSVPR